MWRLAQIGNENLPLPITVDGIPRAWAYGWFTYVKDVTQKDNGFLFIFDDYVEPKATDIVPDDTFEVWGAVQIIPRNFKAANDTVKLAKDQLREYLSASIHRLIQTCRPEDMAGALGNALQVSDSTMRAALRNPGIKGLAHRYVQYETNQGPMTLPELLEIQPDRNILAVCGLPMDNCLHPKLESDELMLDLRNFRVRAVASMILREAGFKLEFADSATSRVWEGATGAVADSPADDWLLRFFKACFPDPIDKNAAPEGVTVRLCDSGMLQPVPATVVFSTDLPSDGLPLSPVEAMGKLCREGVLFIDPSSMLAGSIKRLRRDTELVRYVPPLVHYLAVLLTSGSFPADVRVSYWQPIFGLVERFAMLEEHYLTEGPEQVKRLKHDMDEVRREMLNWKETFEHFQATFCTPEQSIDTQ